MTVLSLIRAGRPNMAIMATLHQQGKNQTTAVIRNLKTSGTKCGGGHGPSTLNILPSRYQWHVYKDQLHFYIFLGVIPLSAIVFYCNVFIGPATLTEIPEGYHPKQWEYYRHPISRFFAQHVVGNMQEQYERNMFYLQEADERNRMRILARKVEKLMKERGDYPNYYTTRTNLGQYARSNYTTTKEEYAGSGDF